MTRGSVGLCGCALAVVTLLAGCAAQTKVDKVESIKASDVTEFPTVIAVIQQAGVDFDEAMKKNILDEASKCGVSLKFFYFNNYKQDNFFKNSSAVMWIKTLNTDTTTRGNLGYSSTYTSRATYEFTIEAKANQKNLWRARMDFMQADPGDAINNKWRGEVSPSVAWSNGLLTQMKKDGVLGSCRL